MENTGIYFKIDAYSAMFQNVSISDIMDYYHIGFNAEDLYSNAYKSNLMFEYKFIFQYEGVRFEVPYALVNGLIATSDSVDSVFDYPFPSIRFDISGSGLDYMRSFYGSIGLCLDDFLRQDATGYFESLGGSMHITRVDFAFDLVGVGADFYDKLAHYCEASFEYRQSDRICLKGRAGGVIASVRRGSERTVYLGTPSSSRLLRVYDKKYQLCKDGVWKKEPLYGADVSSWIRLELQVRRNLAQGLLFGQGDAFSIFRYIYDNYCPVDFETGYKRESVEFWDNLLDWENTHIIIQNANSTKYESFSSRVAKGIDRNSVNMAVFVAKYGVDSLISIIRARILSLISCKDDSVRYKSYKYFIDKLKLMSDGAPIDYALPHFKWENGLPIIDDLYDLGSVLDYMSENKN